MLLVLMMMDQIVAAAGRIQSVHPPNTPQEAVETPVTHMASGTPIPSKGLNFPHSTSFRNSTKLDHGKGGEFTEVRANQDGSTTCTTNWYDDPDTGISHNDQMCIMSDGGFHRKSSSSSQVFIPS